MFHCSFELSFELSFGPHMQHIWVKKNLDGEKEQQEKNPIEEKTSEKKRHGTVDRCGSLWSKRDANRVLSLFPPKYKHSPPNRQGGVEEFLGGVAGVPAGGLGEFQATSALRQAGLVSWPLGSDSMTRILRIMRPFGMTSKGAARTVKLLAYQRISQVLFPVGSTCCPFWSPA